jgi:hypothetical protein
VRLRQKQMMHFLIQLACSLAFTFEPQIIPDEASSGIPHTMSAVFVRVQMNLSEVLSIRRFWLRLTRFVANCLSPISNRVQSYDVMDYSLRRKEDDMMWCKRPMILLINAARGEDRHAAQGGDTGDNSTPHKNRIIIVPNLCIATELRSKQGN